MTEQPPDYTTKDPDHTVSAQAQQVYNYICRHKAAHDGNAPTLRQIAAGSGLAITSTATVTHHLRKLANAGLIRLSKRGGSCGIEVVGGKWTPPEKGGRFGLIDAIARGSVFGLDLWGIAPDTARQHIGVIHAGQEGELWEAARAALGLSKSEAMAAHLLALSYSTTKSKPVLLNGHAGSSDFRAGVGG